MRMPISVDSMRIILLLCLLGMLLLAVSFLRKRRISHAAYLSWGLLAVLVPILGPFMVIYYKPGDQARSAVKGDTVKPNHPVKIQGRMDLRIGHPRSRTG